MELHLEKRCISAYVENQIGVLAKISGLFAGKNYNLDTLTVGETEDPTMSRMTIELTCDDLTYEQIIKQLNRSVEVIKVIDLRICRLQKKNYYSSRLIAVKKQTNKKYSALQKPLTLRSSTTIENLYLYNA